MMWHRPFGLHRWLLSCWCQHPPTVPASCFPLSHRLWCLPLVGISYTAQLQAARSWAQMVGALHLSGCTDDETLMARHVTGLTLLHSPRSVSTAPMGLPPVTRRTLYCQLGTPWMSPPCISDLRCLIGRLSKTLTGMAIACGNYLPCRSAGA